MRILLSLFKTDLYNHFICVIVIGGLVAAFIPQPTFIHYSMIFQQNLNKKQTLIDHFEGYQHMGERAITKSRVANLEGGVLRLDGNIQRSLNKTQRDAIDPSFGPSVGPPITLLKAI